MLKRLWISIRQNPFFVSVWTLFAGAFGSQLNSAFQAGHIDFSPKALQSMATAALITTAIALIHLYIPSPGSNPNPK